VHLGKTIRQIINSHLHGALLGCGGSMRSATGFLALGIEFRIAFGLLGLG
jgi:hypothetical protein